LLIAHRDKLEVIAKALLEFETLDGSQIREIIEHGRLINPPGPPPPSDSKLIPEKPPKQVVVAPEVTPPLPGALGGAPA
jgi:cell division protease FtsH